MAERRDSTGLPRFSLSRIADDAERLNQTSPLTSVEGLVVGVGYRVFV